MFTRRCRGKCCVSPFIYIMLILNALILLMNNQERQTENTNQACDMQVQSKTLEKPRTITSRDNFTKTIQDENSYVFMKSVSHGIVQNTSIHDIHAPEVIQGGSRNVTPINENQELSKNTTHQHAISKINSKDKSSFTNRTGVKSNNITKKLDISKHATPDFIHRPSFKNLFNVTAPNMIVRYKQYECPKTLAFTNVSHIHICGDIMENEYDLILFTTVYYDKTHSNFFLNAMRVTASLQSSFNLQGVIYIENPMKFVDNNATFMIQTACDLGLVVLLCPHCNRDNFPVFKSMFNVTMAIWNSKWYGYTNADMLYDDSLLKTIDFLYGLNRSDPVPIVAGRRFHTKVKFRIIDS